MNGIKHKFSHKASVLSGLVNLLTWEELFAAGRSHACLPDGIRWQDAACFDQSQHSNMNISCELSASTGPRCCSTVSDVLVLRPFVVLAKRAVTPRR